MRKIARSLLSICRPSETERQLLERVGALEAQLAETRREAAWDREFATRRAERLEAAIGELATLTARLENLHTKSDLYQQETRALMEKLRVGLGRIEARQTRDADWDESEFQVFSQFGEDGLLHLLVRLTDIPDRRFVEFGVEDYREANTRFLLYQGWSGLVMDGREEHIAAIKRDAIYWRFPLKAEKAFITRENIDELLASNGMTGEIGLLSIDIDGNDYWVWEAISVVRPALVVVEYNYRFGPSATVAVPYRADFTRTSAHPSTIYFGASLAALCALGTKKGYDFVGCGRNGVNAFFIRTDLRPPTLPRLQPEDGFRPGTFSEYHDEQGRIVKRSDEEQQRLLMSLPLVSVTHHE
ncbi:MAG: hypothetical protein SFU56_19090 [Capsulimonadales bacterium]|nr:hypothetical protein [Capsulimonadales bacterium]